MANSPKVKNDTEVEVNEAERAAEENKTPIGTVEDALTPGATEAKSAEEIADESKDELDARKDAGEPPITSLEMLKDYHHRRGTEPTTEEVDKVRQLEKEIELEGAKSVRGSAASGEGR